MVWASWFRDGWFYKVFPHYQSVKANDPRGVANLYQMGMVAKMYDGDH